MKHFFKGVIAVAIVLLVSILIHMWLNINGVELPLNFFVETMLTSSFATLIYHTLIKNEK